MISQESMLALLVGLVDLIPMPAQAIKRKRGWTKTYPGIFFLKALVIMIVRQVHTPSGLLAILGQPSAKMQALRQQLTLPSGQFACRRTWERRLAAILDMLSAQIACLGVFWWNPFPAPISLTLYILNFKYQYSDTSFSTRTSSPTRSP